MTISAPSALAIGVHLSNVSTASRKSSPSTFSAFVLVTVSSPAIPIKAIFTPSLSVLCKVLQNQLLYLFLHKLY